MAKITFLVFVATVALATALDFKKLQPIEVEQDEDGNLIFAAQGRITNGTVADLNKFPYQAALLLSDDESTYLCGGSLISDRWILTAAHCVDGKNNAVVKLGTNLVKPQADVTFEVSSDAFTIHESWDSAKAVNDIALIRTPAPVQFSEKIQTIPLPRVSEASKDFAGANVVTSGWGKTSDESPYISDELRYVESTVESMLICKILWIGQVNNNHVCMKTGDGKSTCGGDSGGPLVTTDANGNRFLIGITSFGSGMGCEKGFPAVFAKVGAYLSWISGKTGIALRQ